MIAVYQAQGQPRKALNLVQQEAKTTPSLPIRKLLATTAVQAGDLDLAISTAQTIAHDFPQDPSQLIFIGQLQVQKGELPQAVASFAKARELAPSDALTAANYGLALMQAGRANEGIAALRQSVKLQPDSPVLMNNLAWHLAEAGTSLDEAQALAQKAVQIEPSNSASNDTLGIVYLKAGKMDNALQIFQGLARKEPGSPTYRIHLARALIGLGRQQEARTELKAANANRPSPTEAEEIHRLITSLPN